MNAGAVLLTDCVFWFIIVPFLEINNYSLNVVSIYLFTVFFYFLSSSSQTFSSSNSKQFVWLFGITVSNKHAHSQCCFSSRRCCFELLGELLKLSFNLESLPILYKTIYDQICIPLSAVSNVSHCILLPMDGGLCYFPMGPPCMCQDLVNAYVFCLPAKQSNLHSISYNHDYLLIILKQVAVSISWLVIFVCSPLVCS